MKKLTCTAAVAAVALTLSACGTATQAKAGGDATGTNRPASSASSSSTSSSSSSAPEEVVETEAPQDTELTFGESATFDDGLVLNVSKPKVFKPSQYAAKDKAKAYVKFTITLVNKTGATFDPALVYATVQSANVEASTVYDSENGLDGGPSTKLLKGREAKWQVAFGVEDPKDLVMEINPGAFEYADILYTN